MMSTIVAGGEETVSTVWVLVIVWVCRMSNAADSVPLFGPYPTAQYLDEHLFRDRLAVRD
jgi:hypothetical protein